MTRLNSAPQTELASDVYEASLAPLRYLGIQDVPKFDEIHDVLPHGSIAANERLIIVPPALEELSLSEWDEALMEAFRRNQQRGASATLIGGLTIHETFRHNMPDLRPEKPTIATYVAREDYGNGDTNISFAAYVIAQLGLSLQGKAAASQRDRTHFTSIKPTLFEHTVWEPLDRLDFSSTNGAQVQKCEYDATQGGYRQVRPIAYVKPIEGSGRPIGTTKTVIRRTRWRNGLEYAIVDDTSRGREVEREWKNDRASRPKEPVRIDRLKVSAGHMAIAVLPRTATELL